QLLHLLAADLVAFPAQLHRDPAEAVAGILARQFVQALHQPGALGRRWPPLAASALSDDAEAKYELQRLAQRIQYLQQSLCSAEVVLPPAGPPDRVRFGATVTVREPKGSESCYRLVGVDETDLDRNWVSWLSPIAQALLNARLGQIVAFKTPAGKTELEVIRITHD
ncbi:MAG: hypothetical protein EXS39_05160, partial [Opitutaceae bacterium]|nr:hypothetical protein [Opitutaceae bacterium]